MISTLLNNPIISQFGFGLMATLAFLLGGFAFWKKAREEHYDEHQTIDLLLVAVFWSLVGARLAHILFNFSEFGINLFYWLSFWSRPGMHWIGLFLGAVFSIIHFTRKSKIDLFKTLDLFVIGLALSQALVNLGTFLSGSALGHTTNLPLGVIFPNTFEPRHPIGLYGFFLWLGVFFFLWWLEGKYRRFVWYQKFKGDSLPGFLFFVYLISLGVIGTILTLLSQPVVVFYGIDIELAVRISLIFFGSVSLFARSGLGAKWGLDNLAWLGKYK